MTTMLDAEHRLEERMLGRRGATRAAYDPYNPLLLVKKLWDQYPQADKAEIQRRVRTALAKKPQEAADAFIDYATANCIERIVAGEGNKRSPTKPDSSATIVTTKSLRRPPKSLPEKIAHQAELASQAEQMLNAAKNAWRLEQAAPNGKSIGDCTGLELSQFSGFYKVLAHGVGPKERLRDVKNGDDVAKAQTWKP